MNGYFVTGGTGVIGSAIAERLLADGERVTLLVRAQSEAELAGRLEALVRFWGLDGAARARVGAVRGDTTLPRFGLDEAAYDRVAGECARIVHCAAIVKMTLPLAEARRSAVDAARNVLDLARAMRARGTLAKVEFLSTVGVSGRRPGALPERWITEPRAFHNTYEQAKAEAEDYLRGELEPGVPLTLHRPSMVVGASGTGRVLRFQVFYHLLEFLSGRRTRGVFPALGSTALDVVPVDYVAHTVAWSSRTSLTAGRILHLCSGPELAVPLEALREKVRARFAAAGLACPRPHTVPAGLLRAAIPVVGVVAPAKVRRALATLPVFLEYLTGSTAFANDETRRLLDGTVPLPTPASYLDAVLDYYLAHRPASR
jgi:thioester reductase-like protein